MIQWNTLQISAEILQLIAAVDEFKGSWRALGKIAPEQLTSLKRIATIESIGSSTRIEGSRLSDKEIDQLLSNLEAHTFSTRDEQEVVGYAEVMNLLFQNYEQIPLSESYIRQLHHALLQYSEKDYWHRGNYKKSPNNVEAFGPDGKSLGVIFEPASPFEVPMQMEELVTWANEAFADKKLHPLLIIAIFVVVFLAIHPFQDGNGRLSRVLTTYLLLKEGYVYVPYSSMEAVIEQSKEAYYLSLRQTQGTLRTDAPNWQPWLLFFLKAVQKQKDRLAVKLEREHILFNQLADLSLQIMEAVKARGRITISEAVAVTNGNRNTVKKHLEALLTSGYLIKRGATKGAWYELG